MGVETFAIFIRRGDVVGANRHQPAIANFELTMKLNEAFMLPAILGTKRSAAEDKNHGIGSLQFRELLAFRGVIGKLVVREDSSWNNVRSHRESPFYFSLPGLVVRIVAVEVRPGANLDTP